MPYAIMSAAMGLLLLGTQERVRNSCGKRGHPVFYCTTILINLPRLHRNYC